MEGVTTAIGDGAAEVIKTYGLPGFFIILLVVAIVFLWRALMEERKVNKDLNASVVVELRNAITEMGEMRRFFEHEPAGRRK